MDIEMLERVPVEIGHHLATSPRQEGTFGHVSTACRAIATLRHAPAAMTQR